jgi:hypothetical protein
MASATVGQQANCVEIHKMTNGTRDERRPCVVALSREYPQLTAKYFTWEETHKIAASVKEHQKRRNNLI